jgi:NAD-dependent SIR2 family protein deacetylase
MDIFYKIGNECDLLIVMGTALAVAPFCSIVDRISDKTPKVLINMTLTENHDFDNREYHPERLFIKGKCDDTIKKISRDCGWWTDLD